MAVSIEPGQIQFTLILYCARSKAAAFVRPITPCFEAAYAADSNAPATPRLEEVFTITPRVFFKCGTEYFVPKNAPRRLTAMIWSHVSVGVISTDVHS